MNPTAVVVAPPPAEDAAAKRPLELTFRAEPVFRALALTAVVILAIGAVATSLMYFVAADPETGRLARAAARFSISKEPNFQNFFSAMLFLASAVGLAMIAADEGRRRTRDARGWWLLCAILVYCALDDYIMLHEMAERTLQEALDTGGIFTFAWVIPASIFAAVVGLAFLGFLRRIDRRTAGFFVAGGALVVISEIGLEMVAGLITERWGFYSAPHVIEQVFEEGGGIAGILIFLYGVTDHLRRRYGAVRVVLAPGEAA